MFSNSDERISADLLLNLINKFKTVFIGRTSQSAQPGANISVIIDNRSVTAKACTSITPGNVSILKTTKGGYLAFTELNTYQSRKVTPYFRKNNQINKRYIGEVESSTNKTPILFTNEEEIKAPILFSENKKEYGNVGVLFFKYKSYQEYPEELCKCKKWQPLQGRCVQVCNENGEFETEEECNQFRNTSNAGSVTNYYSISNYGNGFVRGKRSSFWTAYNQPEYNAYTFTTIGGIPIKDCLYIFSIDVLDNNGQPTGQREYAFTLSYYTDCGLNEHPEVKRWVGIDDQLYSDSEVIMYFAGVHQQYNYGMELILKRGYSTYDNSRYLGNSGFASISSQYPPPTGGNVFVHFDISIKALLGGLTVQCDYQSTPVYIPEGTQLGYARYFRNFGKLNGYLEESLTFTPPPLPNAPTPPESYNPDYINHVSVEFYLGGDRREPLKLGEYYAGLETYDTGFKKDYDSGNYQKFFKMHSQDSSYRTVKYLEDGNILLPSWFKPAVYGTVKGFEFNGTETENAFRIGASGGSSYGTSPIYTLLSRFIIANIVRLSEDETEICVKYGVFNKSRYEVINQSPSRRTDTIWCNIDIIKVNKGNISKTTYKYPEVPAVDARNWSAPWCTNWFHSRNGVIGAIGSQQSNWYGSNGDIDNSSIIGFGNHLNYIRPEIAQYLAGVLRIQKTHFTLQSTEFNAIPVDKKQIINMGVNFRIISDKLNMYDILPYQPVIVRVTRENIEKEYTVCMASAIKYKDIDVYIRFGESERTAPDNYNEGNNYLYGVARYESSFGFNSWKSAKAKVFKIPEDSIILEISPFINLDKIEQSTLILPDIVYSSNLVTEILGQEEYVVGKENKGIVKWVNTYIPPVSNIKYTYQNNTYYGYYKAADSTLFYDYYYTEPFKFISCNNVTTEVPYSSNTRLYGAVVIEGWCN